MAALFSGAALQRLVALVSQVAIARIVGPSALGELAVAQALIVFSGIFTDGGLTTLTLRRIVREPSRVNALVSVTLAGQAALAIGGMILLDAVALAGPWNGHTTVLILALSPTLLCSAYNMSYVLKASEKMGSVAFYRALGSIAPSVASVVLVGLTKNTIWVAISTVAGLFLSALLIHLRLRSRLGLRFVRAARADIAQVLREGLPFLGSAALLIIPPTSVTVIVAIVLGNRAAGIYSAAWQLSFASVTIAALVIDAIYPEMVRRWDAGQLAGFLRIVLRLVCRVLFPVAVVVAFAADPITKLLFGAHFAATAPILRVLIIIVPLGFLWVILGQALTAANGERVLLRRTLVVTVLTLVAVPLAARYGGLIWVAWTVAVLAALQALSYSTKPLGRPTLIGGVVLRELPYAVVPALLCAAVRWAGVGDHLALDIAVGLFGVVLWEGVRGWPTLAGVRALSRGPAA